MRPFWIRLSLWIFQIMTRGNFIQIIYIKVKKEGDIYIKILLLSVILKRGGKSEWMLRSGEQAGIECGICGWSSTAWKMVCEGGSCGGLFWSYCWWRLVWTASSKRMWFSIYIFIFVFWTVDDYAVWRLCSLKSLNVRSTTIHSKIEDWLRIPKEPKCEKCNYVFEYRRLMKNHNKVVQQGK